MDSIGSVIDVIINNPTVERDEVPLGGTGNNEKETFLKMAQHAKKYSKPEHIAAMYAKITTGMINVRDLKKTSASPAEVVVQTKMSSGARRIIEAQQALRRDASAREFIRLIKEGENFIVDGSEIFEMRMHHFLDNCDTAKKRLICKYIIFRSLVKRYEKNGAENRLLIFIMEFMHIIRRLTPVNETVAGGGASSL